MKFASIRDLRIKPGAVWKTLEEAEDVVLTSNGKPFAVLTRADESSLESVLMTLRRARAKAALESIHQAVKKKKLDRIREAEIEAEIKSHRARRKSTER